MRTQKLSSNNLLLLTNCYKTALNTFLLIAFLLISSKESLYANNQIQVIKTINKLEVKDTSVLKKSEQTVLITDEKGQAIENVFVQTINSKTNKKFTTSADGIITLSQNLFSDSSSIRLQISMIGFMKTISEIKWTSTNEPVIIILKQDVKSLNEVVIVSYQSRGCRCDGCRCVCIRRKDSTSLFKAKFPVITTASAKEFTVYPCPAIKGSIVKVGLNNTGNFTISVFDNSSRLILKQQATITNLLEMFSLQIPSNLASGIYYIHVTNNETQLKQVKKIIVE